MKIGIISDVHSNIDALTATLKELEEEKVDTIISVGDVIGIGPYPSKCIDLLMKNKEKFVVFAKGNHEGYLVDKIPERNHNREDGRLLTKEELDNFRWNHGKLNIEQIEFIKTWKPLIKLELCGKKIIIEHYPALNGKFLPFHLRPTFEELSEMCIDKESDVYIFGHTHAPIYYNENKKVFINPGSLGCPINTRGASYGILEIDNGNISYKQCCAKYNIDKVINEIYELAYPVHDDMVKLFYKR